MAYNCIPLLSIDNQKILVYYIPYYMNIGYLGMNSLKFQLENNDKSKTVSGVYVETNESAQLFFSESIGGKDSHILKAKDVKILKNLLHHILHVLMLMLNFIVSLLLTQTRELILSEQKQKKSNVVIEYNLPNTDSMEQYSGGSWKYLRSTLKKSQAKNANCPPTSTPWFNDEP